MFPSADLKILAYELRKKLAAVKASKDDFLKINGVDVANEKKEELTKLNFEIECLEEHIRSISQLI